MTSATQSNRAARKSTEFDKFDPKQPKASKKRSAQAQITVVERKKKKTASGGSHQSTSINCYECGQKGHTAAYHRKYSSDNSAVNDEKAHANQLRRGCRRQRMNGWRWVVPNLTRFGSIPPPNGPSRRSYDHP
ncbi:hypothetical protein PC119_g7264 [Phytophthora cactorum]|nr:hypothetical protein PC119_g7264 [Phytophthora cactorum]